MLKQITINSKKIYLIGLGSENSYRILEKNIEIYKKEKFFWVYDPIKVDLAYFFANNQHKMEQVTYITNQSFMTVQIKEKPLDKHIKSGDKVLNTIYNNEFLIVSSYYDYHPLKELEKICRYMNTKCSQEIKKLFKLTFSSHPIQIRGSFQPKMREIREKYLDINGLKLKILERKGSANAQEVEQNVRIWKQRYQIDEIQRKTLHMGSKEQTQNKLKWIESNKFGWEIEASAVIEGFGKKYSSLTF